MVVHRGWRGTAMLEYDQQDEGNHPRRICRNIPELMEVLSAEIRFEFLRSLARRPMTVTELARELALRQPCASQHLGHLRRAMLVTYQQIKKDRIYRLSETVEAVIEGGVVYLKLTVADGDSIFVRTQIPFIEGPKQLPLWPWAAIVWPRNNRP